MGETTIATKYLGDRGEMGEIGGHRRMRLRRERHWANREEKTGKGSVSGRLLGYTHDLRPTGGVGEKKEVGQE